MTNNRSVKTPNINYKFIPFLRSFSRQEIKEFGKFIQSPYFNTNKKALSFYTEMKKYYPSFSSENLRREILFRKLYPGKRYQKRTIEKLSSSLLLLIRKYLTIKGSSRDAFYQDYSLLGELNRRKLFKHFNSTRRKAEDMFKHTENKSGNYYLNKFLLENEITNFRNRSEGFAFMIEDNAQETADNLTLFFVMNIMKVYSYMINQTKNAHDFKFKMDFIEPVKNYIESGNFKQIPSLELHYYCMMLLLKETDEYFGKLKKLAYAYFDKIDSIERHNICITLISFCINRYREGKTEYLGKQFEIYKKFLKKNALMPYGYLNHMVYKSIFNCALNIKEYLWARNFIETYKDKLKDEHKSNLYYLSRALIEFSEHNYEKALESLSKVDMEDTFYKFDAKSLTLRIYYELNEFELLPSLTDSYNHMLSKNKVARSAVKEKEKLFIGYVKRLAALKQQNKESRNEFVLQELKNKIYENRGLYNRRWLLDKIEELK